MSAAQRLLSDMRRTEILPVYNDEAVKAIINESQRLAREMSDALESAQLGDTSLRTYLRVHDTTLRSNKRVLLAYTDGRADRIDSLRNRSGPLLNSASQAAMSPAEIEYFKARNEALDRVIEAVGHDFTANISIPRPDARIRVRAVQDCGQLITDSRTLELRAGETYDLMLTDCEPLLSKGLLVRLSDDDVV